MSNSEEHFLYLINKLMHTDLSETERDMLIQLAHDDKDKLQLIKYLTSTNSESDLLEAEIVYEKTKPNDLAKVEKVVKPKKITSKVKPFYKLFVAAASLVFVILCSLYYYQSTRPTSEKWDHITTKRGERKFLTFLDGTEVWLNNDSELRVLKGYGVTHRKMELKGEGYFSVAKNPKLPLSIQTKDTEVKVLGTVFNLNSYPESAATTTSLIEGKVALKVLGKQGPKEIIMYPGDQVKISKISAVKNSQNLKSDNVQLAESISYRKVDVKDDIVDDMLWVNNQLVFNDNTFLEMAIKLRRWYNKEIIIQNDRLLDLSFSGTFEEKECTQVLDILKKTGLKFNYQIKNDTIYIY